MASLLAAAAAPAPAAYPAAAVLGAFADACSEVGDTRANMANAKAAGWERLAADADTPVTRLTKQGMAAAGRMPNVRLLDGADYRKSVSGRTLYLAISGVETRGTTSRGCRLFDFGATRAPTDGELGNWTSRKPVVQTDDAAGVSKYSWTPGLKPGHTDTEIYFIAPGRNPLPGFETSGLTLVASAVE